jgi:hypothetical protein
MNVTADLLRTLETDRKAFDARCEMIARLVESNDKAACEAILRIYGRQTQDEKQVDATKHDNGIGFQQADAKFGGFIARLYSSGRMPYADRMVRVRRMAVKYRRQLAVLSFLKDMAKRMPAGSKTPMVIERALRDGLTVRTASPQLFVDDVNNVCSSCGVQRCPDGCCCAC